MQSVETPKPHSGNSVSKSYQIHRNSRHEAFERQQQISRRTSQTSDNHQYPNNLRKMTSHNSRSRIRERTKPERDNSLTPTNITQVETQFYKIEEVLNHKNSTLESQNDFLKGEINKLYEREKKYREAIRKYKEKVKLLKMEKSVYASRYQDLKEYAVNIVSKVSQEEGHSNSEVEYSGKCSADLVQKLKQELQSIGMKPLPEQSSFAKPSENNSKIYDDNRQSHEFQNRRQSEYFVEKNQTSSIRNSNKSQYSKSGSRPPYSGKRNFEETDKYQKGKQYLSSHKEKSSRSRVPINSPKFLASSDVSEDTPKSNPRQFDELNQLDDKKQQIGRVQQKTGYFEEIQRIEQVENFQNSVLPEEKSYTEQIQELTDESEALQYELKTSGAQDKTVKKKISKIERRIKELKLQREKSERFNELKINEISTDL